MSRRFLIIAAFLLACVSPSLGQHYIAPTIVNNLGQPVPSASIRVCTEPAVGYPCTNPATLYTCIAQNGTCPSPNPLTGDADGNFDFYATNTLIYHFEITGPSVVPYIQSYVYMPGPPGGGGGGVPGCGQYDVQINYPTGTFGGDCGIFQENPSTHTAIDYIFSANQQLQVGDATHTGLLVIRHSNGSSNDANFITGLSPTFSTSGGGYGIDIPDSPAVGSLQITSLTPGADGRLPTIWGGNGAKISQEYMTPVFTTNAPYPTTTSDLVDTLEYWGQDTAFMGPLPPTFPASAVVQDAICGTGSVAPVSCTLPNPFIPGDTLQVMANAIVGISQAWNLAITDSNGDVFTTIDSICLSSGCAAGYLPAINAYTVPTITTGGNITATVTPQAGSPPQNVSTQIHVIELRPTTGIDAHGVGGSITGSTISLPTVTTANAQDTIIGMAITYATGNIFSAGTGYAMVDQLATTGGLSVQDTMGTEATNISTTGTYTPTMTASTSDFNIGFTTAWKVATGTNRAQPYPRLIHSIDLQAFAVGPVGSGVANYVLANDGNPNDPFYWTPNGTSSITGVPPIAITGGAVSLQNSASINITATLGTGTKIMTASGSASTSGDVMEGDTTGGFKDSGTLLSSLAPLASPTFTGIVTTPDLTLSSIIGSTECLQANSSGVVSGTGLPCGSGSGGGLTITTPTPAGIVLSNGGTTSVYSQNNATIDASGNALFDGTVTSGGGGAPYYDLFLGFNASQPTGCGVAGTACIYTLSGSPNTLMAAVDGGTPFTLGSSAGGLITGTPTTNYMQKGGSSAGTIADSSLIDNATTLASTEPFVSGTDNSVAGIFMASNSAANAHTNWESGATTTNTIKGFATAPTTGDLVGCTTSGIICTLTDSGVLAANVNTASGTLTNNAVMFGAGTKTTKVDTSITGNGSGVLSVVSLLASGIIDGESVVTVITGACGTLGGTYNSGYIDNQDTTSSGAAAHTCTLPTAAAGKSYCFVNSYDGTEMTSGTVRFSTSAAGQYIIYGALSATNGYIISGGAVGDAGCVRGVDSTHWQFYTQVGTWTLH
jgi:hypothetical protein